MKKAPADRQDETRAIPQHDAAPHNASTNKKAGAGDGASDAVEMPPWRDAREAMYTDPCLRLQISQHLPGPDEIILGKSAPACGEMSVVEDLPNIAVKHGNLHWILLIIEIYARFLEKKAPAFHIHLDTLSQLRKMQSELQPYRTCDDERDTIEIIEIPLSLSEALALREAILCCRWIVRDWLPDCSERRNLLTPLEYMRRELTRVINEVH